MSEQPSRPNPEAVAAARQIRESLFDLRQRAESSGYGAVSYFLRLAIVEAGRLTGDNVIDLQKKK